jgi:Kef-type K+ transport system membrane component KefB
VTTGALFFLQLLVIVGTCRTIGWLVKKYLGQPHVVGEMVAGVVLGPTIFGLFAPELQQALFPEHSNEILYVIGQFGIGLYMFLVGLSFRRDQFKIHARSAAAVSIAGMGVPFVTAVLISPWLFGVPGLFGSGVSLFNATIFI